MAFWGGHFASEKIGADVAPRGVLLAPTAVEEVVTSFPERGDECEVVATS